MRTFFILLSLFFNPFSHSAENEVPAENQISRVNLRVRPLSLIVGFPGAEIQVGVSPRIAAGLSFQSLQSYSRIGTSGVEEYQLSLQFKLTEMDFQDGFWLRSGFTRNILHNPLNSNRVNHGNHLSLDAGHEWFWSNRFNTTLGAGLVMGIDSSIQRQLEPTLFWEIGWVLF